MSSDGFGSFDGRVATEWLADGRDMQLLEPFIYIDPRGKPWRAPPGSVINGASIPACLWSIVGGPYEGQYRHASVVHDVACVEMTETWETVHQMFYEACRCGGVAELSAKRLYFAVYHFGPKWEITGPIRAFGAGPGKATKLSAPVSPDPNELQRAFEFIDENNPSIDEIRRMAPDEGVAASVPEAARKSVRYCVM